MAVTVKEEKRKRVLRLYKERKISLEKAAELLDVDIWSMVELLKEKNLYLDYTEEELKEDLGAT